jgi:hypothetical protein
MNNLDNETILRKAIEKAIENGWTDNSDVLHYVDKGINIGRRDYNGKTQFGLFERSNQRR